MKFISSLFLFALVAIFFWGCKNNGTTEATQTLCAPGTIEQLFPLKYGDYWIYQVLVYDTTGSLKANNSITYEVRKDEEVNGHILHSYVSTFGTSELYYETNQLFVVSNYSRLILQYPMNIGEVIVLNKSIYTTATDSFLRKAELIYEGYGDDVNLGFEKFICAKYRIVDVDGLINAPDTIAVTTSWYALNKGLVKQEYYRYYNRVKYLSDILELTSYHIN